MGRPPLRDPEPTIRDGGIRKKTRRRQANDDPFAIPAHYMKEGIDYNWKRESVFGKEGEEEHSYMAGLKENGWEPVRLSDMPSFGRPGAQGVVRRDGSVLMWRPKELSVEAKVEDYERAKGQVDNNFRRRMSEDPAEGLPLRGAKMGRKFDGIPSDVRVVRTAVDQLEVE